MDEEGSFRRRGGNGSGRSPPPVGELGREKTGNQPDTPNRSSRRGTGQIERIGSGPRISPSHRRVAEHVVKHHLRVAPDSEFVSILVRDLDLNENDDEVLVAKITFNLAKYAFTIVQQIDQWVPVYGTHPPDPLAAQVLNSRPDSWNFFYHFYEFPLKEASERGCGKFFLRCLCEWIVVHPQEELIVLCQNPAARVARLVDALNFLVASLALSCWETLVNIRLLPGLAIPLGSLVVPLPVIAPPPPPPVGPPASDDAGGDASVRSSADSPSAAEPPAGLAPAEWAWTLPRQLTGFMHHFVVDVEMGDLQGCVSEQDAEFVHSEFRVVLVDNYGGLLTLLYELTKLKVYAESGVPVAVAVDLEGVRLSRHGAIALLQMCLSTDPRTVYIVDVIALGVNAFEVATHSGTSIRRVLEDPVIRKVFFDPRHDVDALYYQYGVVVENVFDLQLAEVALRRARGLTVRYVVGLFKCLYQQDLLLTPTQKKLAEKINEAGKSLFEPEFGGNHEIFLERPLHPSLLVYASHDARYLLQLHDLFHDQLSVADGDWYARVLDASQIRARWFMHEEYVTPTTEAPLL